MIIIKQFYILLCMIMIFGFVEVDLCVLRVLGIFILGQFDFVFMYIMNEMMEMFCELF